MPDVSLCWWNNRTCWLHINGQYCEHTKMSKLRRRPGTARLTSRLRPCYWSRDGETVMKSRQTTKLWSLAVGQSQGEHGSMSIKQLRDLLHTSQRLYYIRQWKNFNLWCCVQTTKLTRYTLTLTLRFISYLWMNNNLKIQHETRANKDNDNNNNSTMHTGNKKLELHCYRGDWY